jgi:hypothetical protein
MNKQEALSKLTALEAETRALRAIIEAPDKPALPARWRPNGKEQYYMVSYNGGTLSYKHTKLVSSEYKHGNCFQTRGHNEIASKAVSVTLKICAAAFAVDPDAGVQIYNERSWSVVRPHPRGGKREWIAGQYDATTSYPIYVHTHEQAKAMAAILNAEGV